MLEMLSGKKVLLLGVSGNVGSYAAPLITQAGAQLQAPTTAYAILPNSIQDLDRSVNYVICLAAISRADEADAHPDKALSLNVDTVHRLINHYRDVQCRIIFASSVRSVTNESVYAYTKIATEAVAACVDRPLVTVMRLGNVIEYARVIDVFVKALKESSRGNSRSGFIDNSVDYFQPLDTIPALLQVALEVAPGTIVTPLLSPTPIAFLAGAVAGFAHARELKISRWKPEYRDTGSPPPLLPKWWIPFTRLVTVSLVGAKHTETPASLTLLATNLKRGKSSDKEIESVQAKLEEQRQATFGEFVHHLRLESRFNHGG